MGKLIFPVKEMAEAPADGTSYLRQDGNWVQINQNLLDTNDIGDSVQAFNANTATRFDFTTTILSTDWVVESSGDWDTFFKATKTITGLLSTDEPIADVDLSGATALTYEAIIADYSLIVYGTITANDTAVFYASEQPAGNITIKFKVVR
jgi:hypothetical protein